MQQQQQITVEQVAALVARETQRLNAGRTIPEIPQQIRDVADRTAVWIGNVGPFQYQRELGTAGTFLIPACPPDKEFALMREPIKGIVWEHVIRDENSFEVRYENGDEQRGGEGGGGYLANQILGVGRHFLPSESLTRWGCFRLSALGPGAQPTKAEITAAKDALDRTAHEMVAEADIAFSKGPQETALVISDLHHWAAQHRKLNADQHPWMRSNYSAAEQVQECPMCGERSTKRVVLCRNCKYIFDQKAYDSMKGRIAA